MLIKNWLYFDYNCDAIAVTGCLLSVLLLVLQVPEEHPVLLTKALRNPIEFISIENSSIFIEFTSSEFITWIHWRATWPSSTNDRRMPAWKHSRPSSSASSSSASSSSSSHCMCLQPGAAATSGDPRARVLHSDSKKMTQIIFETFIAPAFYVAI